MAPRAPVGQRAAGVDPVSGVDPGNDYEALLRAGRAAFPGVRIGRPGRSRGYWITIAVLRVLRLRWKVDVEGAAQVAPGAALLIGNHISAADPLVVVMSTWWRVTAFTKLEWFQGRLAPFFRLMGQIPLRRGDPAATDWAIAMSTAALAHGPDPAPPAARPRPGPGAAGEPRRPRSRDHDVVHAPPVAPHPCPGEPVAPPAPRPALDVPGRHDRPHPRGVAGTGRPDVRRHLRPHREASPALTPTRGPAVIMHG